jgi:toxin-antitoxin system PIN domain toxin
MRCVDVNILVCAHRRDATRHEEYRAWLEDACDADEPLGLIDLVMSGFLRIVTHPRIYRSPTALDEAILFLDTLRNSDASIPLAPGDGHWPIFESLCTRVEATGNVIPDAFLAAIAIESGGTLITADRAFARFPGLRWQHPLDE